MHYLCSARVELGATTNRRRRRAVALLLAAAALASQGCQAGPGEVPAASEAVLPIIGGSVATTCVWPTAIKLIGPAGCSGVLVHSRVVVTAKHCLVTDNGTSMWPNAIGLGETSNHWDKTADVANCYTNPDDDFGLCILRQDVTWIPIVPVMAPCEMSELVAGKAIVEAGFGWIDAVGRTDGSKKWIAGTIDSLASDQVDINVTTGSQDGEYYGDSGGPLYFPMPDGTWRVIGVDCCSPAVIDSGTTPRVSTYKSVPHNVPWAEEVSRIDLTPCHDANGWNPTAACTGFPTNPGAGVGSWPTMCQGEGMVSQRTCAAADAGTDGARHGDAGADSRDGSQDEPGDSSSGDGGADLDGDSDTGRADSGDDSGEIRDSGGTGGRAGSADAPTQGPDSAAGGGSGASAGAGGNGAGGSESGGSAGPGGSESDGSAGAGGSTDDGSAGAGGSTGGARDGGAETALSGGTTGSSGTSGWDGGADAAAVNAGDGPSGSVVDSSAHQPAPKSSGTGCACRSVSDRDAGAWPGLLGLGLVAARMIRRRVLRSRMD